MAGIVVVVVTLLLSKISGSRGARVGVTRLITNAIPDAEVSCFRGPGVVALAS